MVGRPGYSKLAAGQRHREIFRVDLKGQVALEGPCRRGREPAREKTVPVFASVSGFLPIPLVVIDATSHGLALGGCIKETVNERHIEMQGEIRVATVTMAGLPGFHCLR
jgi:hypothetical protein